MYRNMSGEKAASPCNKFQANIFNKSKCQNCFKSRELHLLTDHDKEQAKPIYGGWLCLAPEGTDFENPMQRSRKWQRRFFILYEHGSLSFALDELRSTLPQGTVNLNLCTDIADAEPRTGQRNALCVVTPEQEIFIRGDNKEIINGWSEQLAVYLRTNKQNQKKKRKVEPVATQDPSPAKMAATDPTESGCGRWQEEQRGRGADVTPIWTVTADTDAPGPEQNPADNMSSYLSLACRDPLTLPGTGTVLDSAANGHPNACIADQLAESNGIQALASSRNRSQDRSCASTSERMLGSDATAKEQREGAAASRRGRSEARTSKQEREKQQSCGVLATLSAPPPQRRAKSLDRRTSGNVMTPDLLNFKKGWMMKLDENYQWKKYWFVLSTDNLRYYKDSVTEESSDLKGEIDLTRCYNVCEHKVQRNYGFQIHTTKTFYTLSAMTAGIRKNWINSLMKNVHPAKAPDVTRLPLHPVSHSPPETLPKPDVTQESCSNDVPTENDPHPKPRSVLERRREGRYKTYDWAEFRTPNQPILESGPQRVEPPCSLGLGDLERRRRREERRRKYESMLGFSLSWEEIGERTQDGSVRPLSPKSQQRVEEEIGECWKQVEKTVFRLDRTVPLFPEVKDTVEMEKLLDIYREGVEDLKVQLAQSEFQRLELEAQLGPERCYPQQVTLPDPVLTSQADFCPLDTNEEPSSGRAEYMKEENGELSQQQNIFTQDTRGRFSSDSSSSMPSICLQDTERIVQEVGDFPSESAATPFLSPVSPEIQRTHSQNDGQVVGPNSDGTTASHQRQMDREDQRLLTTSDKQINNSEYSSNSMMQEEPAEGGGSPLNGLVEQHISPDQAVVRRLSREVEQLTSQNEALHLSNQEMLNQLTEADREIERLKAELSSRYTEPHLLPEVEQQDKLGAEDLERELSLRERELLEAQMLIASLKENLTEAPHWQNIQVEEEDEGEEKKEQKAEEGYLQHCFEATEAKLTGLERQLDQSETDRRELQAQNAELKEAEKLHHQRAEEAEADVRRLSQELEEEKLKGEKRFASGEERIQQVIEGMVVRLEALGMFLEVINKLDFGTQRECEYNETIPAAVSQLKWEEGFWSLLLRDLQASPAQSNEEKSLLREVTEHMIAESEMLLVGQGLVSVTDEGTDEGKEGLKALDIILDTASVTAAETENLGESETFDLINRRCHVEHFRTSAQVKIYFLSHAASSASITAPQNVQSIARRLKDSSISEHPWFGLIHSAATEALYCCHLSRLQSIYEKELEETKLKLLNCNGCVRLMEENRLFEARLSNLEEQQASAWTDKRNVCCQTDETITQHTDVETQTGEESTRDEVEQQKPDMPEEEMVESSINCVDPLWGIQEVLDENFQENEKSHQESESNLEVEQVEGLRRRVKQLEELLSVTAGDMTREFDGKMICVQMQHGKEMEKLKATCQHGFVSMEESHLRGMEELQRRHQQEVERLQVERDQLLEEESAATATAIEAIKNAHRLELEREVQRNFQSLNGNGNAILEDIHRQHCEELASYQRELEVLSQQFSLKCLENGHLFQALDAERKALCQCQQENQDLRTRNQELSGNLAAEITRLCLLAKQDDLLLSQGMDVYEMEITLRVKESEVQCLKQEITSLKDELQSAQRDKRVATKKYKDSFTELSIVRAKTQREIEELRENLRLAHRALDQTST